MRLFVIMLALSPAFEVDLRKLRYYSKLYRLNLDNENVNITCHCMHSANSHSVQLLFVSYSVYLDVSDQTLVCALCLCLLLIYLLTKLSRLVTASPQRKQHKIDMQMKSRDQSEK